MASVVLTNTGRWGNDEKNPINIPAPSRRARTLVGASLLTLTVSGGIAQAASVSTTGSTASNSGRTITVKDTKAEGDNAYANWNNSGGNRVTTSGGNGSTASVTPSTLTDFRACRDQGTFNPDNCTSYVTP